MRNLVLLSFALLGTSAFADEKSAGFQLGLDAQADMFVMGLAFSQVVSSEYNLEIYEAFDFPFSRSKVLVKEKGVYYQFNKYSFHLGLGLRHFHQLSEGFGLELKAGMGYFPGNYAGTSISPEFEITPEAGLSLCFLFPASSSALKIGYDYYELYATEKQFVSVDWEFIF